jgi:tryptophan-rich sensory protein
MTSNAVRGAVDRLGNSRGRSVQHIAVGLGLTAGAVALSALAARLSFPASEVREVYSDYEEPEPPPAKPPSRLFAVVWPPLFMALTLSGLRIWNAPRSNARTQALTLWGLAQALNATWMALGPNRLGGQLAAVVASLGTASAYVWRARKVDPPAVGVVAPDVGWLGFAGLLSDEIAREPTSR